MRRTGGQFGADLLSPTSGGRPVSFTATSRRHTPSRRRLAAAPLSSWPSSSAPASPQPPPEGLRRPRLPFAPLNSCMGKATANLDPARLARSPQARSMSPAAARTPTSTPVDNRHRQARRSVRHQLRLRQPLRLARLRPSTTHPTGDPEEEHRRQVGRHHRDPALDPPQRPGRSTRSASAAEAGNHASRSSTDLDGLGFPDEHCRSPANPPERRRRAAAVHVVTAFRSNTRTTARTVTVTAKATDGQSGIAADLRQRQRAGHQPPLVRVADEGERHRLDVPRQDDSSSAGRPTAPGTSTPCS